MIWNRQSERNPEPRLGVFPALVLLLAAAAMAPAAAAVAAAPSDASPTGNRIEWIGDAGSPQARVNLYFFWSKTCPHCREALPFVQALDNELDWLVVRDYELTESRENVRRYVDMAALLGRDARSVPAFFICERMLTGFDSPDGIGAEIRALAELCRPAPGRPTVRNAEEPDSAPVPDEVIRVPMLGNLDATALSLPLLTVVIAGLDAFNPCAFFVLLFLLSLMVHARSRARMLIVGGTFVVFSGLVYFLFMAAWLNLFLVVGAAPVVTTIAGLVAILIGGLNVKDFFRMGAGPSLSIPAEAKSSLFRRMRGLLSADHLGTMLLGTVALALAANSYELLCTAGFPMVYTRALTLHALPAWSYYGYLGLYNLIYVLPLLGIVLAFTLTLGARKLSERQGRMLKLLSGAMMLGLGITMLMLPEALSNPLTGLALLLSALVVTGIGMLLLRRPATT